jgi:predicted transglutaminase-like cysteine proteinase
MTGNPNASSSATPPELAFAGYRLLAATPDDPVLAKWRGVRTQLDCSQLHGDWRPGADLGAWNAHVNATVHYLAEPPGVDIWQTPAFTVAQLTGDCEDYAILKYALLMASGVPEQRLRIVVGQIKSIAGNEDHTWLAFFKDSVWCALDYKFPSIIAVTDYVNWLPMVAVHADTAVVYGREFSINDVLDGKTRS